MKKLFSEVARVDEVRSVGVEELPDGSFGIRGVTMEEFSNSAVTCAIRFSPEAIKILTGILNRLHAEQNDLNEEEAT